MVKGIDGTGMTTAPPTLAYPTQPSSKRSQANELKIVLDVTGDTKKVSVRKMTKMTERTETSVGTFSGIA